MIRKLFFLIGISFLSSTAYATITVVQAASDYDTGSASATVTITLTAGNLLYVVTGLNGNGSGCGSTPNPLRVTDTLGNTYTVIGSTVNQTFNCGAQFYAKNISGGSATINLWCPSNQAKAFTVYEISGLDTTAPLDASNGKACSAFPCTSAAFSTAQANEIVLSGGGNYYTTGAWAAGAIGAQTAVIVTGGSQLGSGDQVTASAIEYSSFTATQSSITAAISKTGSVQYDHFVATFKEASGGAAVVPDNPRRVIIIE